MGVPSVVQGVKNPNTEAQVTAAALIQSLAQELPYASDVAIKKKKERKKVEMFTKPRKCFHF